jgi:hypothetical protein
MPHASLHPIQLTTLTLLSLLHTAEQQVNKNHAAGPAQAVSAEQPWQFAVRRCQG